MTNRRISASSRLLVARLAWLVLYPLTLGLLVASMGPRFSGLVTLRPGAESLLQPGGGAYGLALFALETLILIQFVANTLLMAWRRSADWVPLYTSFGGLTFLAFVLPGPEALIAADPSWTGAVRAAQWLGAAMPVPFLFFFPDGHFVPRRSVILALTWPVVWAASAVILPGGSGLLTLPAAGLAVWLTWVTAGLAAQVYRIWSIAGPLQRQQTKWLLASIWVLFVGILLVLPARFLAAADVPTLLRPALALPVLLVSTACFGMGFWIAILRYRLWDIDIVVRRTIVYGALTAVLAATYFATVAVLQAVLFPLTSGSDLAVAGSTLAVGVLFAPLRGRIQTAVDRRFNRSRYDAARIVDALGARLRNEIELDLTRAELRHVVAETMQPAHVQVWLRGRM